MKSKVVTAEKVTRQLAEQITPKEPHVYLDPDYPIVRINHHRALVYDYNACKHVNGFLSDTSCNNKIIVGAYGSGKSSAILQHLLWRAVTMPFCNDGVRRYKALIVRASTPQLESTTLQTWLNWSSYLPKPLSRSSNKLSQNKEYRYQIYDKYGMIDFTLYFLPLDSDGAAEKLDSFEATDVFINELRHIPKSIWTKIFYRAGRYPDKLQFDRIWRLKAIKNGLDANDRGSEEYREWFPYIKQQISDTNAPSKKHWIPQLESANLKNRRVYHQPPQILKSPESEWTINTDADNLPYRESTYWLSMLEDEGEDFANVYACGFYGLTKEGKPVYPQFSQTMHIKKDVKPVEGIPLLLTLDISVNSFSPAGLMQQLTAEKQYRALQEFCLERGSIKSLCEEIYLWWQNTYPDFDLYIRHDPAAEAGKDIKDIQVQTPAIIEKIFGIESLPAKTNKMDIRIDAPKHFMKTLDDLGVPSFIINEQGCPTLIDAFVSEYHYKKQSKIDDTKFKDTPEKNHPHSDVIDCCQYGCLEYGGAGIRQNRKKSYNIDYNQFLANNTVL